MTDKQSTPVTIEHVNELISRSNKELQTGLAAEIKKAIDNALTGASSRIISNNKLQGDSRNPCGTNRMTNPAALNPLARTFDIITDGVPNQDWFNPCGNNEPNNKNSQAEATHMNAYQYMPLVNSRYVPAIKFEKFWKHDPEMWFEF